MKIETKYSCGDKVYTISSKQEKRAVSCGFCGGKKRIEGKDGEKRVCPECYGRTQYEYEPRKYMVDVPMCTVGQVRFEYTKSKGIEGEVMFDNYKAQEKTAEEYMLVETGVGSGTLWKANLLHSTKDEAQMECDNLNEPKEQK